AAATSVGIAAPNAQVLHWSIIGRWVAGPERAGRRSLGPRTPPPAPVGQDLAGRVRPGAARHAAPRMRAGSAQVQAGDGQAVPGLAQHGPPGEELIEAGLPVEWMALGE